MLAPNLYSQAENSVLLLVQMIIEVHGQSLEIEERICGVKGCTARFHTMKDSKQSICSKKCYELKHGRMNRKSKLPPIKRPKPCPSPQKTNSKSFRKSSSKLSILQTEASIR